MLSAQFIVMSLAADRRLVLDGTLMELNYHLLRRQTHPVQNRIYQIPWVGFTSHQPRRTVGISWDVLSQDMKWLRSMATQKKYWMCTVSFFQTIKVPKMPRYQHLYNYKSPATETIQDAILHPVTIPALRCKFYTYKGATSLKRKSRTGLT